LLNPSALPAGSIECRCGHGRSSHMQGKDECRTLGNGGRWCGCSRYVPEDPLVCASREECIHEILEFVATMDRRYARLPRPPW